MHRALRWFSGRTDAELCNDCATAVNELEGFMFTWLFALLTTLCALLWSPVAYACKCAEPEAPSAALASAKAVFQGEVSAIQDSGNELVVTLKVPRTWKGIDSAEEAKVRTRRDSAACGFPFAIGENYLVYASALEPAQDGVSLQVLRCGRTRPIAEAADDMRELGLGAIPVSPQAPNEILPEDKKTVVERKRDQPAAGGCASCSVGEQRGFGRAGELLCLGLLALSMRRGVRRFFWNRQKTPGRTPSAPREIN
jgi:hypothetical protein